MPSSSARSSMALRVVTINKHSNTNNRSNTSTRTSTSTSTSY